MLQKYLWIFFILSISTSLQLHAKTKDFFRLSGGGLLISGVEMKYAEVIAMINKEKSWQRVTRNHYILNASVGGKFDVHLKFSRGKLTQITAKQLGRADYR